MTCEDLIRGLEFDLTAKGISGQLAEKTALGSGQNRAGIHSGNPQLKFYYSKKNNSDCNDVDHLWNAPTLLKRITSYGKLSTGFRF